MRVVYTVLAALLFPVAVAAEVWDAHKRSKES